MFNKIFPKIVPLSGNVEKYDRAGQATDDTIISRMRTAFWMIMATDKHLEYFMLLPRAL